MFRKLRYRFIKISMLASAIVIFCVLLGMNFTLRSRINRNVDYLLEYLAEHDGEFSYDDEEVDSDTIAILESLLREFAGHDPFSGETAYSTRYFSVDLDHEGNPQSVNISHIASITEDEAYSYASAVLDARGKSFGQARDMGNYKDFRYRIHTDDSGILIVFVYYRNYASTITSILYLSVLIGVLSLIGIFILVWFFSKAAIRPMVRNSELQKQFITDAGHEIKTPLAIISANADVLELENGESEWIDSIRAQTDHMGTLIRQMLTLAKAEEMEQMEMTDLRFDEIVTETADSFAGVFKSKNHLPEYEIESPAELKGNRDQLTMLVSILLDNALKYAPDDGEPIRIRLKKKNRRLQLQVTNSCAEALSAENLENIFQRFYRVDSSRNRKTGGHGIGLSIARSVAEMHKGSIRAFMEDDHHICFEVML